jgi:uncharacterized membrane protein YfcA
MVTFLIPLLIASLLGFLAGMGVGGGSLLLLWLTQVAMIPQEQAKLLNLLFFLPAAAVSTLFRKKQKITRPDVTRPGIIAGCIAAAITSIFARYLDLDLMKKLLGGLLILTGLKEIFYRPRKAK